MTAVAVELWRPIPLAPGYEASDSGRIRSFRRGAPIEGRILALSPKRPGSPYRVVRIHHGGSWRVRLVHQLVLEAFVGPRPKSATDVRHLNGDGSDNRPANLAWGTASENMQDRLRLGEHHYASRTACSHGHDYTPENTYVDPAKPTCRSCRTCQRARSAQHKARRRDAFETRKAQADRGES